GLRNFENPTELYCSLKNIALRLIARAGSLGEEATVDPRGAVYQPELIELMKSVLEEATAMLPEAKRTSAIKAEIASQILASAARGERNPLALRTAALSGLVESTHYSHDISPARRAV
ncbi:MAG: hypothetical protein JWP51_1475, partial [Bradyrhizobium sp.]|nr:hypothetical protein [Bradyrhizobium sp.]